MKKQSKKNQVLFAATLCAALITNTSFAAEPSNINKILYSCTIQPRAAQLLNTGTDYRRATTGYSDSNKDYLYNHTDRGRTKNSRFTFVWKGFSSTTGNQWHIQVNGGCLNATKSGLIRVEACQSTPYWRLDTFDGDYLIKYKNTTSTMFLNGAGDTASRFNLTDSEVSPVSAPASQKRMRILDCLNSEGFGVSPAL